MEDAIHHRISVATATQSLMPALFHELGAVNGRIVIITTFS
ncbi:hypothetical protein [Salinicoccus sp. YB14-2]|nr:hypothetical protein [Salinicoccus sp. YB14-2]